MIGNFFLGDEKDSKFDATGFTQVTGVNSRRGEVVQEFNTQVQTITKGKGIMSAIRNKGYLNDTTGELKNIADFQKEWKQKAEKFNKQITQSV